MTTISILKIDSENGTLLFSKNATQEIFPISKSEVKRNLNFEAIDQTQKPYKCKCIIETKDIPDLSIMTKNKLFNIHSIIKFRHNNTFPKPELEYVSDSLENYEDHVVFRPILKMYLINFNCKNDNDGNTTWKLEFEEK